MGITPPRGRSRTETAAGRIFLVAVPTATALIIAGHPTDPRTASDLGTETDRYIAIHVGLLLMLPLLGIVIWSLLARLQGVAATVARVLLPVALVSYAAFDALIGIGAGVLAREAMALTGAEQQGAEALAARWMSIPMPLPIVSTLATLSWTATLLAAAAAHARAGSPLVAIAGLAVAGPLFGFGHPFVTGVIAMGGLVVAVIALERRDRSPVLST